MTIDGTTARFLRHEPATPIDPMSTQASDELVRVTIGNYFLPGNSSESNFEAFVKSETSIPYVNGTYPTTCIAWTFVAGINLELDASVQPSPAVGGLAPEPSMTTSIYLHRSFIDEEPSSAAIPRVGGPARWFNYVEHRLTEFELRSIVEGDNPSTCSLSMAMVSAARQFAMTNFGFNTPTPSVVPSEDGGIEFIWHKGGWDIQVAVGLEGKWVWARNHRNGETWYGSYEERSLELSHLLDELSSLG